jgi:proteic killer suppression protein
MIRRIRHKGLDRFFKTGDARGINPQHAEWLRILLTSLDAAQSPADMQLPGYRLHPLKGERKGQWAVSVSGNWRLVFRFEHGHATAVDLIDYH